MSGSREIKFAAEESFRDCDEVFAGRFKLEASSQKLLRFVGDLTAGDPPVPIPNTEVKPRRADGTARAKCVGA